MTGYDRAIDRVVDAFRDRGLSVGTATGGKYSAQCPVHGGRDRRVSISQKGDKASIRCWKGWQGECPDEAVLAAVGLTVADLYDKPRSVGGPAPIEHIEGQDELDLNAPNPEPTPWDGLPITPGHRRTLDSSAITPDVARAAGIHSITRVDQLPDEFANYGAAAVPALAFPWVSPSGQQLLQLRPDKPITRDDGTESKYLWPAGVSSILNAIRPVADADVALIVEGTKQGLAAASYAAPTIAVYGVAGCRSWSTDGVPLSDLEVFDGKKVVIAFDADLATNADVHAAATRLTAALTAEGAKEIKYLTLPAAGKTGLDDLLATRTPERRAPYLARLIALAKPKLPAKPAHKPKKDFAGIGLFNEEGLLVEKLAHAITARHPAALTREHRVALYRDGVFHIDGMAFSAAVATLLGDRFRPGHRAAAEEFTAGMLYTGGLFLPDRVDEPLLNVRNGMLDLATGTLKPHDPCYLSSTQLPITWDPHATCPTYEKWLIDAIGDQADDLEEVTSTMLDPSRTPTKALFLFGPSRSGKSTYLRLMQAVAGHDNMSAVTLHLLVDSKFASANVYGKILNCGADMSSAHVDDVSVFKMMTGEDPITADRKYGSQFTFVNRALFAFSANELPTVSESSRAYVERIKPFEFAKSFAGSEDPTIEARMLAELPGILVRWVRAWQRLTERGGYRKTDEKVRREFETRSDRVRQWVTESCEIHTVAPDGSPVSSGHELPMSMATTKRALAQAFNRWAKDNNGSAMGERKIFDRLTTIPGVVEVRRMPGSVRALNISLRADSDEGWPVDNRQKDLVPAVSEDHPAVSQDHPAVSTPSPAVSHRETNTDWSLLNHETKSSGDLAPAVPAVSRHKPPVHENMPQPDAATLDVDLKNVRPSTVLTRVGKSPETAGTAGTAGDQLCAVCAEPLWLCGGRHQPPPPKGTNSQ